jgi:hypothetical protein
MPCCIVGCGSGWVARQFIGVWCVVFVLRLCLRQVFAFGLE